MLIGEVAKRAGLSKDGVRHYEALGLIKSTPRGAGSRVYRDYDEMTLERLALIRLGKRLHFPLRDIAEMLDRLLADQISREERAAILLQKVSQIEAQIADLRRAQAELMHLAQRPEKDAVDAHLLRVGLV
jgi:MerR family copper efflux transcriptional regulator